MKVVCIMVMTLNGKITKDENSNVSSWASDEDQKHFTEFIQKFKVSIMGANTYEASKKGLNPNTDRLRIILTRDPKKYEKKTVPGKIEFTSEKPKDLLGRLDKEGFRDILLLGGGEINSLFFEEDLVTDFYLTLEPKLFGSGRPVVADGEYFLDFRLKSAKKLNTQGTYLFHYAR